jgi:hypothetical protein
MLWQNSSNGDRSIWLMTGSSWDGSYALLPRVVTAWSIAATGDFNDDGDADIVWQNTVTGDRSIWFMNGNSWEGDYALLPQVATEWSIAGAGDFNSDTKPDLVWQNTTTGDRSIWFLDGATWDGSYALLPNVAPAWRIAAVADFNPARAYQHPDLVWENTDTGERSIWFMVGATWTGSYELLQTVPTSWRIAAAADFDGDRDPDLVWQNTSTGERSIWFMDESKWLGSYASLPTISTAWSIAGVLDSDLVPEGPTNLTATVASSSQINLTWDDNAYNETGFRIQRCVGEGCTDYVEVAEVGSDVTSYQNTGLVAGRHYRYQVGAFNAAGSLAFSGIASATTLCDLSSATAVTGTSATVGGALAATDCHLSDGSFVDVYSVTVAPQHRLTVQMRSSAFDTYLRLIDNQLDPVLAEDDDGGGGTNSLLVYENREPSARTYYIFAGSFDPATSGQYTLNVSVAPF